MFDVPLIFRTLYFDDPIKDPHALRRGQNLQHVRLILE